MKNFRNSALALAIATYLIMFWTAPATAGLIGSTLSDGTDIGRTRTIEIAKIQRALENEVVTAKLGAYGLQPDQINAKISRMDDNQIHMLAQASDNVLAGGDGVGFVIGVLMVVLLVLIIMKLMNKEIIVR